MEDVNVIWALGRVVERLAITAGAILSITLGWHLFKTGVVVEQEASGEFKNVKIISTKVGPGAFFAMFGSAILGISLIYPATLSNSVKSSNILPENAIITGQKSYASANMFQLDIVKSSNAVASASRSFDDDRLKQASATMEKWKMSIALELFSQDQLLTYTQMRDTYRISPQKLTPKDRETVKAVSEILELEFDE